MCEENQEEGKETACDLETMGIRDNAKTVTLIFQSLFPGGVKPDNSLSPK